MSLRWEWRAFGVAEGLFASLEVERVEESDETYLLSAEGTDAVKVRKGLMDIKHLEEVGADGLELWRPVLKTPMPIPPADVPAVLAALRIPDLAARDDAVRAVPVHKTRHHYAFAGCMAELTDISTLDRSTRSVAIESEDPAAVAAAVRSLGFDPRDNTNVPAGLRALAGVS